MAQKQSSLGDRYAEIAVILITAVALLAGWFYKTSVENSSLPFSAEGVTAEAPKGWLQAQPSGDTLFHAIDLGSSGYGTNYTIRKLPVAEGAVASDVVTLLSLEYGRGLIAFRVLDQQEVSVFGRNAFEMNYVFIESHPDLTHSQFPSVVRGTDYIFANGDHVIVISFRADEKNYDLDLGRFHRFLQSIQF
jgi:hypothetical protein